MWGVPIANPREIWRQIFLIFWKTRLKRSFQDPKKELHKVLKLKTLLKCNPNTLGQKLKFSSSFFGRIEDTKITFRDYLTLRRASLFQPRRAIHSSLTMQEPTHSNHQFISSLNIWGRQAGFHEILLEIYYRSPHSYCRKDSFIPASRPPTRAAQPPFIVY